MTGSSVNNNFYKYAKLFFNWWKKSLKYSTIIINEINIL